MIKLKSLLTEGKWKMKGKYLYMPAGTEKPMQKPNNFPKTMNLLKKIKI